jgi:chromosome segregation ATPase
MKIKAELPSLEKVVGGLDARTLHPALAAAELAVTKAGREVDRVRGELAGLERKVSELPERIRTGTARPRDLADSLVERDACALQIEPIQAALAKARDRVTAEEKAAKAAIDREIGRRVELLEKAAAEVSPYLDELAALAAALASTQGPGAILTSVTWPSSPAEDAQRRQANGAR